MAPLPTSPQLSSEPKLQATTSVQQVDPATPVSPGTPDTRPTVKNRLFSNVTEVSADRASPTTPHSPGYSNFVSKFWASRSPASRNMVNAVDEKNATSTTLTPDDVSELEDLETHWHMISEEAQRKLGKDWKPTWQLRHLILRGLRNWLMVVIDRKSTRLNSSHWE